MLILCLSYFIATVICQTNLPLLTLFTEKQLEDSKGDEEKHEMRPLVDKNKHQQNAALQPRRPQIVIGENPENKQLAPTDTCTTVAPSVAGAGVNFAPSIGANANYGNFAPSVASAGVNFAPSIGASANYENFAPSVGTSANYENVTPSVGANANFAPSTGAGANFPTTSGANGQETKPNSANVIHCNFVLKRTNDPVHQI